MLMQDRPKMGNYEFSVMLQDWKEQRFSSERSKAVPVPQHFARKRHRTTAQVEDRAESTATVSVSKHMNYNSQQWM